MSSTVLKLSVKTLLKGEVKEGDVITPASYKTREWDLIKEGVSIASFRYVFTRVPDDSGKVYERANSDAFKKALSLRAGFLALPNTTASIEYEYIKDETAGKGDGINIPLATLSLDSIKDGFTCANEMHALKIKIDALKSAFLVKHAECNFKDVTDTTTTTTTTTVPDELEKALADELAELQKEIEESSATGKE